MTASHIERLHHGRTELALHELRAAAGRPLLLLHGLGERTPHTAPAWADAWPGAVWGLDFTGHGQSTVPHGGGYTAEMLMADADAAVGHLGAVTIVGRGLGGYIGLLVAGARAAEVHGIVVCDGPGLSGGGGQPGSPSLAVPRSGVGIAPDPFALIELARDMRPADYIANFVRFVLEGSPAADPVAVAATNRPEWLAAVAAEPGVVETGRDAALATYAAG